MTVAELFSALRSAPTPGGASASSLASYEYSAYWVLQLALDIPTDDLPQLPATVLNKSTARCFFAAVERVAKEKSTQAESARWLRSAYSMHTCAMALFSERAVESIRRLLPPDLSDWRNARRLFGRRLPPVPSSPLPDPATVRRTLTAWVDLGRTALPARATLEQRNMFIAVGLQLACGLRAGEVAQARWSWFSRDADGPLLVSDCAAVKNRTGSLSVVPLNPFWRVLNFWIDRHGWRGSPDAYCLACRQSETVKQGNLHFVRALPSSGPLSSGSLSSGSPSSALCPPSSVPYECVTDRTIRPQRNVSAWLRGLGWRTMKTNHALRDWSASMVTMRYGLQDAQYWCRHSSLVTTQRNYNRFVNRNRRSDDRRLRWLQWAK